MTQPAADFKGSPLEIAFYKLRLPSSETPVVLFSLGDQPRFQIVITHHLHAESSSKLSLQSIRTLDRLWA
eukprot:4731462-Amphidinium_carterae.1